MEKPSYPMRINKYLALNKGSTRRAADELIKERKVLINGRLAVLGDKVMEGDKVEVRFHKGK
jgi:16S rRNA U516 pseudouridylate synthase RsuA-like enzyme